MKFKDRNARALSAHRQTGYTLVEAGFAVVIATIIATAGLAAVSRRADNFRVEKGQQEMKLLLEAGMQYRRDTGAWPANVAALKTGNYIPNTATSDDGPFGGKYSVAAVTGGTRLRVSYNATQLKFANLISATLPYASVGAGGSPACGGVSAVCGEVVVPGIESAHDALLPRDGSRPMTGALNMNGNQIANAGNITGSGNWVTTGYMQSNTFYDYYNSAYYVQPRGTSRLNEVQADRVYGFADIRTPVLYDYNDTTYRVDPNASSVLSHLYTTYVSDWNDSSYYLDMNGTSKLNGVYANAFYDYTKGVYNDQAIHHVFEVGPGQAIPKPSCYGGHIPRVYTTVSQVSDDGVANPIGGIQVWADDAGGSWIARAKIYTPAGMRNLSNPAYTRILAFTKCE